MVRYVIYEIVKASFENDYFITNINIDTNN